MRRFPCALIFILIFQCSAAQHIPKISFGNLDTAIVSVEEFNQESKLKIEKGYKLIKATVYFSGANFPKIISADIYPNYDSLLFFKLKKIPAPGSAVDFDVILTKNNGQNSIKANAQYLFYSVLKRPIQPSSLWVKELKRLSKLKYKTGTIYFSGSCFSQPIVFSITSKNRDNLKTSFDRSCPGSVIVFDNVVYEVDNGKLETLNMTFNGGD